MRDDVAAALDQCLEWMRAGTPVETCLARYPEYATELRPLLQMVPHVGRVLTPPASRTARDKGQKRMLAALDQRRQARERLGPVVYALRQGLTALFRAPAAAGRGGRPVWQSALLSLILLVLTGSGLALAASSYSLPGEPLYPMKLARQELHLALTFDPVSQASLERRLEAQRRREVGLALAAANRGEVHFAGTLEEVQADRWDVSGLTIQLDERTKIGAEPALGAQLRVRGRLPGDGSLRAVEIEVLSSEGDDPPALEAADAEILPGETRELTEPAATEPAETAQADETATLPSTPTIVSRPPDATATPEPQYTDEADDDSTGSNDTPQPDDDDDDDEDEEFEDDAGEPEDDAHDEAHTPEPDETPDD